ncbi:MAG: alpha-L-fucosidase [Candidatus Latescibacterota bacterium]
MIYPGHWHGKHFYFGLHYDLHAGKDDTDLGTRCSEPELIPMLELMNPDFVQTDCKGHAGYTSWFSEVPDASVPPNLKQDALKQWRAATRKLGLPLHCHYSGIWDRAAAAKHPEWRVVLAEGPDEAARIAEDVDMPPDEKMCPRSPYLEELLIPQMLELIDRYQVDGFWVDGDMWAVEPCYCDRCRGAFARETGIEEPPIRTTDPNWPVWWNFTRESFEAYVTRYCEAVHQHKKGVLVCSNWLQTFKHPGAPSVPTDWISGDNTPVYGLDGSRCEARFLSTRGKHWDIMLWCFYFNRWRDPSAPHCIKPVQMLQQEAAVLLSFGGSVQVYETPGGLRDGRLVPWRQKRLRKVGQFVKRRRSLCQDAETIPQVAVLHSEHHLRRTAAGRNLMWDTDVSSVQGATFSLLENHFGVDILDEWAFLPRLSEFPIVVVPEQHALSDEMVQALKDYVVGGGKLLVSGAASFDRFGESFLGVTGNELVEKTAYQVPAGDGTVPLYSDPWRLIEPTTARSIGPLGLTPLLDDRLLPHAAATINKVGKGAVAYVPGDLFRDFERNHYPLTRVFVGEIVRKLAGKLDIEVKAPICIDVALRKKGSRKIIHLVNRGSGIPNQPNDGAVDEIPTVGPVVISMRTPHEPKKVHLAFEKGALTWAYRAGKLTITVAGVHIHAAVVVE